MCERTRSARRRDGVLWDMRRNRPENSRQRRCVVASLPRRVAAWLRGCAVPSLCRCVVPPLRCCIVAALRRCGVASLRRRVVGSLRRQRPLRKTSPKILRGSIARVVALTQTQFSIRLSRERLCRKPPRQHNYGSCIDPDVIQYQVLSQRDFSGLVGGGVGKAEKYQI